MRTLSSTVLEVSRLVCTFIHVLMLFQVELEKDGHGSRWICFPRTLSYPAINVQGLSALKVHRMITMQARTRQTGRRTSCKLLYVILWRVKVAVCQPFLHEYTNANTNLFPFSLFLFPKFRMRPYQQQNSIVGLHATTRLHTKGRMCRQLHSTNKTKYKAQLINTNISTVGLYHGRLEVPEEALIA